MKYWIIKGNPRVYDLNMHAKRGRVDRWRTKKPPREWSPNDRVFFWSSAPRLEIVAVGTFLGLTGRRNSNGESLYDVKYLTDPLQGRVTAAELRADPICAEANFLRRAVAQGVLQVSLEQANQMYRLIRRANDGEPTCWLDIPNPDSAPAQDVDEAFVEGGEKMRLHVYRERSAALIQRKRDSAMTADGRLICEVCGFDFRERYGALGDGFCEVHHKVPIATLTKQRAMRIADLAVVCSNCHRMLHRGKKLLSVKQLARRLVDA